MMHYFIFFVLSISSLAAAQQRQSNISPGSSLTPTKNSSWVSKSGLYAFGFYPRGNGYAVGVFLAGIPEKTVVWTAHRDDPPVSGEVTLLFTAVEGKLVLQTAQGQDTNIADTAQAASHASMLDTGNFVLYNSSGDIIWQSFAHPTDTLLPTQHLSSEMQLISSVSKTDQSTGIFGLYMQADGNLVQYPNDYRVDKIAAYSYWSSGTYGMGDKVTLNLDVDGNLKLLNGTDFNVKNITDRVYAKGMIYLMRVDWDGLFRLYSHDLGDNSGWSVLWNSTSDRCDPKGLCGLNSFCISDQEPGCSCLPGFVPVNQGNWTSGCERNFTESCKNKGKRYTLQVEDNTIWEDVSYSVLSQTSKEDCKQACLVDCNCEAALYKDGQCKKQRPPLRFGRRTSQDDSTTFIKVEETSESSIDRIFPTGEGKREIGTIIIIIICLFVSLLIVNVAILGIIHHRYRVSTDKMISYNGNIDFCGEFALRSFSNAEIERMTDGFKEDIGRGASSTVYKGTVMNDGEKFVAVKKLQNVLPTSEKEFQMEIKVIGRAHHRNLLRLLGYSIDGPNKVLVYEYMPNGSLADILFTPGRQLCWVERMGIARDIARGILYLHDECETQIIHCDIKPQNILMDENGCAKICDFGLAKLMKPDETKTFTGIRGTRGYVAPEWHRKLPVTVKADVYSYGVMLLEIICCRKKLEQSLPDDEVILEEWVYQCFEGGELGQLVGVEEVEPTQLERIIKVALWCILDEPSLRPSMKKVLLMLEGTVDIPIPPNPTSFISII